MASAVTMKDIADRAGVTKTTVSKVLNGRDEHISEETRRRVRTLIRELDYVPNSVARGLKTSRTRMLGFILPDITNPFYPEITRGLEDEAEKRNYGVVLCNTDNSEKKEQQALRFLYSRMVDGIVFIHTQIPTLRKGLEESPVPVVVVDRSVSAPGIRYGQIGTDVVGAVKEAARLLLRSGCRHPAFISAGRKDASRKYCGYLQALVEAGLTADDGFTFFGRYDMETGNAGIREILRTHPETDGLVAGDDLIALGAIHALETMEGGRAVPLEFAVIGFGDNYMAKYMKPALTTVHQPAYEMGTEAARTLIDHIEKGVPLGAKQLPYSLVVRESAAGEPFQK